jgi:ribulose-phosphate 3-epimerase
MSVNPGYGGQAFIPSFLKRCERLRTRLDANGLAHVEIEVDGGIKVENARSVIDAGANMLVSGSGVFPGAANPASSTNPMPRHGVIRDALTRLRG